jgi:hypothetical protein
VKEENTLTVLVILNFFLSLLGYLYPDRDRELTEADTLDKLRDAMKGFEYEKMLNQVTDDPTKEKASEFSSQGKSIGMNQIRLI